jgi:hypothetical protein
LPGLNEIILKSEIIMKTAPNIQFIDFQSIEKMLIFIT